MVNLNEVTLARLSSIVDDRLVFGAPVCFPYWYPGYSDNYPQIAEVEQQLEARIAEFMQSMTVGKMLHIEKEKTSTPQIQRIPTVKRKKIKQEEV